MATHHSKPSAKNAKGEARRAPSKFQFEEGNSALDRFTRTIKALFRAPKSTSHPKTKANLVSGLQPVLGPVSDCRKFVCA